MGFLDRARRFKSGRPVSAPAATGGGGLLSRSRRMRKTAGPAPASHRGLLQRAAAIHSQPAAAPTRRGLRARAAALEEQKKKQPADAESVPSIVPPAGDSQAGLRQALDKRELDLTNLFEISKEINSTLRIDELISILLFTCMGQAGTGQAFLCTRDRKGDYPLRAQRGLDQAEGKRIRFQGTSVLCAALLEAGGPTTPQAIGGRLQEMEQDMLVTLQAQLLVPLINKDILIGILGLGSRYGDEAYDQEDLDFLSALASMAAVALENARLFSNLEQKLNQLSALYDISRIINSTNQLDQVLALAAETLGTGFGFSCAAFFLYEEDQGFVLRQGIGLPSESVGLSLTAAGSVLESVLTLGEAAELDDLSAEPELANLFPEELRHNIHNPLFIPLVAGGRKVAVLGIFSVAGRDREPFSREEKELYSIIASQLAPPILMASMMQQERRSVSDPFHPFLELLLSQYRTAADFSLSLGVARLRIGETEQAALSMGGEQLAALLDEAGHKLRQVVDERFPVVRSGVNCFTLVLPGLSLGEQSQLLQRASQILSGHFAAHSAGQLVVHSDLAQIPEERQDPYCYLFQ